MTTRNFSAVNSSVVKFTPEDNQETLEEKGAAQVSVGDSTIYIGTEQVSANNQNPIITRFTNGERDWVVNNYETGSPDGRGVGLLWDGEMELYAAFTVDGGGSGISAFTREGWLNSYGTGGGAKVTALVKLDPETGRQGSDVAQGTGTFVSALLSNGNVNTLTPTDLSFQGENIVLDSESFFSPRRTTKERMEQTIAQDSPFPYQITFEPDLSTAITAVSPGWDDSPLDVFSEATAAKLVFGTLGEDNLNVAEAEPEIVFSGAGNDTVTSSSEGLSHRLYGGTGNNHLVAGTRDRLFGGEGDDRLNAVAGTHNRLYGGAGNDYLLVGEKEDNLLMGNEGEDQFWVQNLTGNYALNRITDFTVGEDTIGFAGFDEIRYSDLVLRGDGLNTMIQVEGKNILELKGVNDINLSEEDFLFAEEVPFSI